MERQNSEFFVRSAAVLGDAVMSALETERVAVVGVGGVGGWCAEALVRTGLRHLTIIDFDQVAESNLNRQCPALADTMGMRKTDAMAKRLKAIAPDLDLIVHDERFEADGSSLKLLDGVSLVIDAIDSVDSKAELILEATERNLPIVSSMGAALRTDPTAVKIMRFDKVTGDGLARALRARFKKLGRFPAQPFTCVCSSEKPIACETRGSLMQVTATFGMALAAKAIELLSAYAR